MSNAGGYQAGTAVTPAVKVEISVICKNLKNMDVLSKSDPMCVMYTKDVNTNKFVEFGRTEKIKDNLNPEFTVKFIIDYLFEASQKLRFEVYDIDSSSSNLAKHDFIGANEISLGEIVGTRTGSISKELVSEKKEIISVNGQIIYRAEELSSSKDVAKMRFEGKHLAKKNGFLGKSDPFLTFYRANEDNSYTAVHRTEVIKNTLNPSWQPFSIPIRQFCNGDYYRSIRVECLDWNSNGKHSYIGEFMTNMQELNSGSSKSFEVTNVKKKKPAGEVRLVSCRVEKVTSFLDYIQGGLDMNFVVAVDFTSSNGDPRDPSSLHYYNPHQMNQYASAISSVGEIIQDYDTDKLFPALGFGAKLPGLGVSHEFALNFKSADPYCSGINGVLAAYYNSLKSVTLAGPTNFAPVINHVANFAAKKRDGSKYFVLLIITDGIISDMAMTKEAIIKASKLPMSIIIVGVGEEEFDAMVELDSDDVALTHNEKKAERDIVQFVAYREFISGANSNVAQARLAKEVLAELPDQVIAYMKSYGIKP